MSRLETTVTYLEMRGLPPHGEVAPPRDDLTLHRARKPTVSFYRWLYERVGAPWLWTDRRKLDDDQLAPLIQHDAVEIWVLYVAGVPAGYLELDRRQPPDIELAYFGLLPEFIGHHLGAYLLDRAIRLAFTHRPTRLWLHTQTLDHPRALPLYQRLGFTPYKTERLELEIALP